jgi:hypothetical protein
MSTTFETPILPGDVMEDWYESHDSRHTVASFGVDSGALDTPKAVLAFFEKPWNYTDLARLASAVADIEISGATKVARSLPAYTKVNFAVNGSKVCEGLTRDIPRLDGEDHLDRRITNLSSGFEFFVTDDTAFDTFEIVEFDGRG